MIIETNTVFEIKKAVAKKVNWDIKDFEIYRSGTKAGRPNYEIEHHITGQRYAFTAFDEDDINGLHIVN